MGGNQNNHIVGSISYFYVAMLLHDDIPVFNGHHKTLQNHRTRVVTESARARTCLSVFVLSKIYIYI